MTAHMRRCCRLSRSARAPRCLDAARHLSDAAPARALLVFASARTSGRSPMAEIPRLRAPVLRALPPIVESSEADRVLPITLGSAAASFAFPMPLPPSEERSTLRRSPPWRSWRGARFAAMIRARSPRGCLPASRPALLRSLRGVLAVFALSRCRVRGASARGPPFAHERPRTRRDARRASSSADRSYSAARPTTAPRILQLTPGTSAQESCLPPYAYQKGLTVCVTDLLNRVASSMRGSCRRRRT